ncbi:S-adenosyl-L-methionine-dependent methyltransferase [Syncephalastrum racemosum]|uniref:S-adenosyl-L-methionine-dependent methyltransferase n=1 Tax=Syncephalastrum racemosum TaxID=13706 RepID=A0A1X2HD14_SYNRA|nr:S-adenosyl-L-methionine-dependent methyltransferase [Syncephalastrum racemosum]
MHITTASERISNDSSTKSPNSFMSEDIVYLMPTDGQDNDRIHSQHWALKLALGGNYDAPVKEMLEDGANVLDSGCGPGTWSMEMSETYPQSKFHGIDVAEVFPQQIKPKNCNFKLVDLTAPPLPYADDTFDYIHQRLLFAALGDQHWDSLIPELHRLVKPGGWVEMQETDDVVVNAGPSTHLCMEHIFEIARGRGANTAVGRSLKSRIADAGFVNISERIVDLPLNHGGKIGELFCDDMKQALTTLEAAILQRDPENWGDADIRKKHLDNFDTECTQNKTALRFRIVIGQKPSA